MHSNAKFNLFNVPVFWEKHHHLSQSTVSISQVVFIHDPGGQNKNKCSNLAPVLFQRNRFGIKTLSIQN